MDWNDTILNHPRLSPTDKLVFHLLERLGGDSPPARRQLAALLRLSERHLRRVCDKLQQCGKVVEEGSVDNSPPSSASVDNWRTCMSAVDIQVRWRTPVSAPLTRVRTSPSSSSEEDSTSTPLSVPTPQGGAGGTLPEDQQIQDRAPAPDPVFLAQMQVLWQQIDPAGRPHPESWFVRLYQAFGPTRSLSVLQRFALAEKTLDDLTHPASFKSYFTRWCRREQEEDEQLLALDSPPRASPREASSEDLDGLDLSELYQQCRPSRRPASHSPRERSRA